MKKRPPKLRSVPAPHHTARGALIELARVQRELTDAREQASELRLDVLKSTERITRAEAQAYLHREQAQRAEALLSKALEALPILLQPVQAAAFEINAQPSHFQGQDMRFALTQWLAELLKRLETAAERHRARVAAAAAQSKQ